MTFIDTHAHLYDGKFAPGPGPEIALPDTAHQMLQRAFAAGITEIWMPNCAAETVPGMLALAAQFPGQCLPMMGLHPTYVTETVEQELAHAEARLNQQTYLAVGEIGLDFYWDMTHVSAQFMALETQLRWAAQRQLFVSLHTRSGHNRLAMTETLNLLEKLALPGLRGIFHCFVGTLPEAQRAIEMGFLLGIGGVVTFKKSGLEQVLPVLGLENLVLETDAPYLAPVPFRGKRNEPAYLPHIAARLAELTNTTVAEVAQVTTDNALRIKN